MIEFGAAALVAAGLAALNKSNQNKSDNAYNSKVEDLEDILKRTSDNLHLGNNRQIYEQTLAEYKNLTGKDYRG